MQSQLDPLGTLHAEKGGVIILLENMIALSLPFTSRFY